MSEPRGAIAPQPWHNPFPASPTRRKPQTVGFQAKRKRHHFPQLPITGKSEIQSPTDPTPTFCPCPILLYPKSSPLRPEAIPERSPSRLARQAIPNRLSAPTRISQAI
ncbi:hypothetical protein [Phormidium sp. CCY1219]|uniref:hypothetical protein n=1 Tax=Phormidium sp. CCY1219 TaxID=2886104 RepID=UPI002D1F16A1|nr:hypothetical protein [Phormidium sp. CCY1219]MEB3827419.1 hypothetical protein [Phormidium sp. CCY1219]